MFHGRTEIILSRLYTPDTFLHCSIYALSISSRLIIYVSTLQNALNSIYSKLISYMGHLRIPHPKNRKAVRLCTCTTDKYGTLSTPFMPVAFLGSVSPVLQWRSK